MDKPKRNAFLETVFGWAHMLSHAKTDKDREAAATHLTHYVLWAEREHGVKPDMENYIHALDNSMNTVLTYKEALAVHDALRAAHNVEKTRLQLESLMESSSTRQSSLFNKLSLATHIMDMQRERAEDMGG